MTRMPSARASFTVIALALAVVIAGTGCGKKNPAAPGATSLSRHYLMGFSSIPPNFDFALAITAIRMWIQRADAAIAHVDPPWDSLLAGTRADSLVMRNELSLMQYYRSLGLKIVYEVDPTNGLNRSAESVALVAAGRSISEPAIQALFRAWVVAVDTLINPEYLGLASETNLIRIAAPPSLYNALKQLAGSTADTLTALHARLQRSSNPQLYASVQVETAWGRLGGSGAWQGVATDRADFPFAQVYGLSSYPYLGGFVEPEDIPSDYYSRVAADLGKPVMIVEGGWTSETVAGSAPSTPARQARYLRRQPQLLDAANAMGVFQLTFTDIAQSVIPPPPPGTADVAAFAHLGLVDTTLAPKLALGSWDSTFARPRR